MSFLQGRFVYQIGYIATLVPMALYLITLGWITPYRYRVKLATLWPGFVGGAWLKIAAGVSSEIRGLENLPKGPFVAVCNHQSEWETLVLARLLCPTSVVMKESLLRIPVYGWGQRLLHPIAIDRGSPKASIRAILSKGLQRLREGNNVLIFPEGTRVDAGSISKYKRTAFKLAVEAGTPIVPVVHNSGDFWIKKSFNRGSIKMVIGEPLNTEGFTAEELTRKVESWSQETYKEISSAA